MNHYVYEITNLVNGKKYIGKRSCKCPIKEDRYMGSGKALKCAIDKYGKDNFRKDILQICENEQMAFEWEKVYIEQVKAYDNPDYYNIALGGHGFSSSQVRDMWKNDEYRSKMIKSAKDLWKNDEYRIKMRRISSETMKKTIKKLWEDDTYRELQKNKCAKESKMRWKSEDYRKNQIKKTKLMWENEQTREKIINSMKIKFSTEENKAKRSEASRLNWCNEAFRNRQIDNLKDRWNDQEFREHMSIKMKDKFKEKEYVEKMQKIWDDSKRQVIMLNNKKVFKSCIEASEYVDLSSSTSIVLCCQGKRLSAGKFEDKNAVWMYYDEYLRASDEFIQLKITKSKKNRENSNANLKDNSKKVICLNTKTIFNSLKSAAEFVGLKQGWSVSKCCLGNAMYAGKINGEPARWMYYEDYLNMKNKEAR